MNNSPAFSAVGDLYLLRGQAARVAVTLKASDGSPVNDAALPMVLSVFRYKDGALASGGDPIDRDVGASPATFTFLPDMTSGLYLAGESAALGWQISSPNGAHVYFGPRGFAVGPAAVLATASDVEPQPVELDFSVDAATGKLLQITSLGSPGLNAWQAIVPGFWTDPTPAGMAQYLHDTAVAATSDATAQANATAAALQAAGVTATGLIGQARQSQQSAAGSADAAQASALAATGAVRIGMPGDPEDLRTDDFGNVLERVSGPTREVLRLIVHDDIQLPASVPIPAVVPLISLPGLGDCVEIDVDPTGKPWRVVTADGGIWALVGGVLTLTNPAPGSGPSVLASARIGALVVTDNLTVPAGSPLPQAVPLITIPFVGDCVEVDIDAAARPFRAVTADGTQWELLGGYLVPVGTGAASSTTAAPAYVRNGASLLYNAAATDLVQLWIVWGQSLALGANADAADAPVSTTALYPNYVWMFDAGVWPNGGAVAGFVGLKEQIVGDPATGGANPQNPKESLCSGFGNTLYEQIKAVTGQDQRILMAIAAHGGADYANIQRGSPIWAEAIRLTQAAVTIAKARGLRVQVNVICQHGEQNNAEGTGRYAYARMLTQARANFQADLAPLTSQTEPVRMFVAQCNRGTGGDPRTPTAVRDAAANDPLIIESGPIYWTTKDAGDPAAGGGAHPCCVSYVPMGEQHCHAAMGELHSTGYQPMRRINAWWQTGTTIRVQYNKPVAIDTSGAIIGLTQLGIGGAFPFGFLFSDGAAAGTPVINNCTLVSGTTDTIELTLSAAPAAKHAQLFYACIGTGGGAGRLNGARGTIRAATSYGASRAPGAMPLYEWACVDAFDLPPV